MAKRSPALATPLRQRLESLAAFEPTPLPLLSLYLDLTADQHGRDNYDTFLRKVFADRLKGFRLHSPERESFERDTARIRSYLTDEVKRASRSLALFACAGADDFFDAMQLEAAVGDHSLFIGSVPHLYPLARLVDQYPRYAAVLVDTHQARILVFSLGAVQQSEETIGVKTRRTSMGGWSQARYQRHAENFHLHHMKDLVGALGRIVSDERIEHLVVAGDEVAVPLLKEQLPAELAGKLVDVVRLERHAGEHEVLTATLDVLRRKDAETDAEHVAHLIDAWQSNGLGVVGPEATLKALTFGQVDELLITSQPEALKPVQRLPDDSAPGAVVAATSAPGGAADERRQRLAGDLVTRAEQTGARIRFIEDAELLAGVGGVGALLRFRI